MDEEYCFRFQPYLREESRGFVFFVQEGRRWTWRMTTVALELVCPYSYLQACQLCWFCRFHSLCAAQRNTDMNLFNLANIRNLQHGWVYHGFILRFDLLFVSIFVLPVIIHLPKRFYYSLLPFFYLLSWIHRYCMTMEHGLRHLYHVLGNMNCWIFGPLRLLIWSLRYEP